MAHIRMIIVTGRGAHKHHYDGVVPTGNMGDRVGVEYNRYHSDFPDEKEVRIVVKIPDPPTP